MVEDTMKKSMKKLLLAQLTEAQSAWDNMGVYTKRSAASEVGELAMESMALSGLIQSGRKLAVRSGKGYLTGQPDVSGIIMKLLMEAEDDDDTDTDDDDVKAAAPDSDVDTLVKAVTVLSKQVAAQQVAIDAILAKI